MASEPVELTLAPVQWRARVELGRELRALGHGRLERGVLAQDRVVQPSQLGSRLDADLRDERGAGGPVGVQRVALAPRSVKRQHALAVQPLAQRLALEQRFDLGDHLGVATSRQVIVDGKLGRAHAQLLQATDRGAGERFLRDV